MYIQNAYYKAIPVTGATFPLAAGTIVTANGTVPASAADYYGIVPEKVDKMPTTGYLFVAVSGTIDLDTCGVTFTDAQIKALGADFNFVRAKEEHEPPAPELPTVSAVDNGKVLTVVNGAWAAGSGGGGGGAPLIVEVLPKQGGVEGVLVLDKTASEILNAMPLAFTHQSMTDGDNISVAYANIYTYTYSDGTNPEIPFTGHGFYIQLPGVSSPELFVAATGDDYPEILK